MIVIGSANKCFCGGQPTLKTTLFGKSLCFYFQCAECHNGHYTGLSISEALKHWNTKDKYQKRGYPGMGMDDFEGKFREIHGI